MSINNNDNEKTTNEKITTTTEQRAAIDAKAVGGKVRLLDFLSIMTGESVRTVEDAILPRRPRKRTRR
jgi:hypothetical protein